jgi:hypothetical protein
MNKHPKVSKETLGLAGEYAVASELCRRGLYSQLTLGNHKRTDILVETDERVLRISVKSKQGYEWPWVNGPVRADDFLVFVDFAGKAEGERPDFYVMNLEDWKKLLSEEIPRHATDYGIILGIKDGIVVAPDGRKGIGVKLKRIVIHKERWDKITMRVDPKETTNPKSESGY